jgi:hypothetical protein
MTDSMSSPRETACRAFTWLNGARLALSCRITWVKGLSTIASRAVEARSRSYAVGASAIA